MAEPAITANELVNLRTVGEGLLLLSKLVERAAVRENESTLHGLGVEVMRQMGFSLLATSSLGEMPPGAARALEETLMHLESMLADRASQH